MTIESELAQNLEERRQASLYRQRLTLQSAQQTELQIDDAHYLSFCSNDYLGLAAHPRLIAVVQQAAAKYGVGSGASHLVCGHHSEHEALEQELAAFLGRERALLFSTGYMANLGVISALLGRGDLVLEDRLNHASLLDAGLLSGARFRRYQHNDIEQLGDLLENASARRKLVVVDGVFSMDGDVADLPAISSLCQQHDAWLMVDDAHGFGCLGEQGQGVTEHFGLAPRDVPVLMGTLGKALGSFGAFVAGSETLIESLIQFARPYIYTTALPPAIAAASREALRLLKDEAWRRTRLAGLISYFRRQATDLGLPLMPSNTAIQPLLVGEPARALQISQQLHQQGILVTAIRPPTVAAGSSRLRITLSANHNEEQVMRLLDALRMCDLP